MSNGKAFIVQPVLQNAGQGRRFVPTVEERISEAEGLAHAIFLEVVGVRTQRLARPSPGHLIGKGAREEIATAVRELKPDVVIVNHVLSPTQQRNLERSLKAKVLDRTGLILEIFGARAQTAEGRIQVDLAALEHQKSRLVRQWTHLERQRGGLGKVGGPGEKQIELDKRMLAEKISRLKKDLEQVRKNREIQRKSRERIPYPIVALIGYTNAGKSTLFNRLTGSSVFVEDLLFATLDPTMRKLTLSNGQDIILSDTVGFIADLPTNLVAAFRATLEQVQYADVILHIRDAAHLNTESQKEDVISIMGDLGIEYETDPRIIEVLNKIDLLNDERREDIQRKDTFDKKCVALSALTGAGIEKLLQRIEFILLQKRQTVVFKIPLTDGQAVAWLYEHGKVLERKENGNAISLTVDTEPANIGRFKEKFAYEPQKSRRQPPLSGTQCGSNEGKENDCK